jgi:hypothetical protein
VVVAEQVVWEGKSGGGGGKSESGSGWVRMAVVGYTNMTAAAAHRDTRLAAHTTQSQKNHKL